MREYRILPKGYNDLGDFEPEEKYGIFLADSLFKDFKDIKNYIELTHKLEKAKKADPMEFLGKGDAVGFDNVRKQIAEAKKADYIQNLENQIKSERV
mgnify:CR=1 FL=1